MNNISEHKIISGAKHNIHKLFGGYNPAPPIPKPVMPMKYAPDVPPIPGPYGDNKAKTYNLTPLKPVKVNVIKAKTHYQKNALT